MAQNSRIAISAQNSMARSTTSIESNSSHEKSRIEVPREPPDIDFAIYITMNASSEVVNFCIGIGTTPYS